MVPDAAMRSLLEVSTELQCLRLQAGQPTGLRCSPDAAGSHQLGSGDGHRLVEVELLCLNESLSDSGSPPHIYFNSLFMPEAQTGERTEAGPGATPDAGS